MKTQVMLYLQAATWGSLKLNISIRKSWAARTNRWLRMLITAAQVDELINILTTGMKDPSLCFSAAAWLTLQFPPAGQHSLAWAMPTEAQEADLWLCFSHSQLPSMRHARAATLEKVQRSTCLFWLVWENDGSEELLLSRRPLGETNPALYIQTSSHVSHRRIGWQSGKLLCRGTRLCLNNSLFRSSATNCPKERQCNVNILSGRIKIEDKMSVLDEKCFTKHLSVTHDALPPYHY